jgi:hypothetical protein
LILNCFSISVKNLNLSSKEKDFIATRLKTFSLNLINQMLQSQSKL